MKAHQYHGIEMPNGPVIGDDGSAGGEDRVEGAGDNLYVEFSQSWELETQDPQSQPVPVYTSTYKLL